MRRLLAFFLLLAAASGLRAQQHRDSVYVLPPIEVTARRGAEAVVPTGRATRLDSAALAQTAAATLADLLARRGGAFVRPYGPAGLASVSLRGTGAAQTLVLLDGFPLTDPQLGQVDLTLVPAALLQRADVLYGSASAWHGTSAMGGVVALTSHAPGKAMDAAVAAEAGAFGLRGISVSAQRARVRVDVTHRQQEGDFSFQMPAQPRTVRQNADLRQTAVLTSAAWGGTRGGLWLTDADRGLPGVAGTPARGERQHDQTLRAWVRHVRTSTRGAAEVGVALQAGALRYRNPTLGLDETGRTQAVMLRASYAHALAQKWQLGGGGEYGFMRAAHPSLTAAREQRGSVYGHLDGQRGCLTTSLALRADVYAQQGRTLAALSPRLGVGLDLTRRLRLLASAGRSFRVPTFNDRFWQPGGNPDLRPERAWTSEGGLRWRGAALTAEVTVFALAVRNQIVWLPDATGPWHPLNVGRVRTRGLEASVEWRGHYGGFPAHAGVFYTRTSARDRTTPGAPTFDQPLRYVPRETARLYHGITVGALALDLGARYTGTRFVQTDGGGALDPYVVADAQVRVQQPVPGGTLDASFVLENALGARYSVLQGYPMPGRHVRFRLAYTWRGAD